MKQLLYLLLLTCSLLASCRSSKSQTGHFGQINPPVASNSQRIDTSRAASTEQIDSAAQAHPEIPKTVIGKLVAQAKARAVKRRTTARQTTRKCKNCTFVTGTGNTISSVGKKGAAATGDNASAGALNKTDAPVATGRGASSVDNTKQGQRGGAATSGDDSPVTVTKSKGINPLVFLIPLGLYAAWRISAATTWGRYQAWLPAVKRWPLVVGVLVLLGYVLYRLL